MSATRRLWTEEIRERCERATPGPWQTRFIYRVFRAAGGFTEVMFHTEQSQQDWLDSDFIAHAREDIPRLLDAHDALVAALREVEESEHDAEGRRVLTNATMVKVRAALKLARGGESR